MNEQEIEEYWKVLNGNVTILQAAKTVGLELTEEQVKDVHFPYNAYAVSAKLRAYHKLVEIGEIDSNVIYNLGAKSQDPSDIRENDYGVCGDKAFVFVNGNWNPCK